MDEIIESEDSCVYCSKYLFGLNDFNKKMHYNTCKVRKLVESNYATSATAASASNSNAQNDLDDFLILGDNCSYCFKSFKDFKSDFNKRIHIKCCKIKKETFEHRNQQLNKLASPAQAENTPQSSQAAVVSLGDACIFCTKPLANLNDFNKKMHLENCKIRKSIEGNFSHTPKSSKKDENLVKLSEELGAQCMYCSKSFANLSDFNKKLHFEHCKLKKKKLNSSLVVVNATQASQNQTQQQVNISHTSGNNNSNNAGLILSSSCPGTPIAGTGQNGSIDLGDNCMFCSRSLVNLSNFNKKVHVETCKIKQLKKATASQLKQTNKTIRKRANTSAPIGLANKKEKTNQSEFCAAQIITALDIANVANANSNANNSNNSPTSTQNQSAQLAQFDPTNATILSLSSLGALDNTTIHQINLATAQANSQNLLANATHTLQITLDPNTNRIYI